MKEHSEKMIRKMQNSIVLNHLNLGSQTIASKALSATRLGYFWKVLGAILLPKVAKASGDFSAILKNVTFDISTISGEKMGNLLFLNLFTLKALLNWAPPPKFKNNHREKCFQQKKYFHRKKNLEWTQQNNKELGCIFNGPILAVLPS